MHRLATTILIVLAASPTLAWGAAQEDENSPLRTEPGLPQAICHQYCALADAQRAAAANRVESHQEHMPVAMCHQYCAFADAMVGRPD
jgi:hypothetical protein